jgi:hypothetical protein
MIVDRVNYSRYAGRKGLDVVEASPVLGRLGRVYLYLESRYLLIGSIPVASEMQAGMDLESSVPSDMEATQLPAIIAEAYILPHHLHPFQPFAAIDRKSTWPSRDCPWRRQTRKLS